MFSLETGPLEKLDLKTGITENGAGAIVIFEGIVRDDTAGRKVIKLEYQASPMLAKNEFDKIADELRAKFAVRNLRCAHRTGTLLPGEMAVWAGVTAKHRGAAFDACRYLVDHLKHRLPIWKKEFFADGESAWVDWP